MMTLGAWLHTIDPFAIRVTSSFGLRWYGLAYLGGFVVGWLILRWMAKRGRVALAPERLLDHLFVLILGVLVGGRLGYVLIYDPQLLVSFSSSVPFWDVLALNRGGMASHGGMVGVLLACFWIARSERLRMTHVCDAVSLAAPAGLFFGRLANFVNGELLGRIVAGPGDAGPWWSVQFPQELMSLHRPKLTDAQLGAMQELLHDAKPPELLGTISGSDLYAAQVSSLIDLVQRGTGDFRERIEPLLAARHPSQLYQALAEGLVLGAVLLFIWRKPRKPGVIMSWFLLLYGVMRVATEFWRLPDDQFLVDGGSGTIAGLSRGQWLSVVMIVVGGAMLVFAMRRDVSPGDVRPVRRPPEGAEDSE